MPTIRVAVCQYAIDIDDPAGTLERLHASVAEAAESNPDVIVFPELCTSGYVFRDIAEANSRAEPVDGPTVRLFRELSLKHHAIVVGGFCERPDGDVPSTRLPSSRTARSSSSTARPTCGTPRS